MEINTGDSPWLDTKAACKYVDRSPSTLKRWVDAGKIPPPRKPTKKSCYYLRSDLDAYIENKLAEEDLAMVVEKKRIDRDIERFRINYKSKPKRDKLKRDNPKRYEAEQIRFAALKQYGEALTMVVAAIQI